MSIVDQIKSIFLFGFRCYQNIIIWLCSNQKTRKASLFVVFFLMFPFHIHWTDNMEQCLFANTMYTFYQTVWYQQNTVIKSLNISSFINPAYHCYQAFVWISLMRVNIFIYRHSTSYHIARTQTRRIFT